MSPCTYGNVVLEKIYARHGSSFSSYTFLKVAPSGKTTGSPENKEEEVSILEGD